MFKRLKPKLLFLNELYGRYKLQILVLTVLAVLSGALGALGIVVLVPLFSFIVEEASSGQDPISRFILGGLRYFNIEPSLKTLLILISSLFVLKAVVLWFFGLVRVRIISSYSFYLRKNIYQGTVRASWPYLIRHKLGYLENILMMDVQKVKNLLKDMITFVLQLTSAVMYLIVAFGISVLTTAVTLLLGAVILLFSKPFIGKIRVYAKKTESIYKLIAHKINENILGLKAIKAARVERAGLKEEISLFEKLRQLAIKRYFVTSFISQPVEPFMIIFISAVFAVSYSLQPDFNIASFLVVVYLIQRIFAFVSGMQRGWSKFNNILPHAKRVIGFQRDLEKHKERSSGKTPFQFINEISFEQVGFAYSNASIPLEDITFRIQKGEIFGIVGPSGSGKTTLVDLLLRFFNPQTGKILVDGLNIADISFKEWRENFGYVTQDSFLRNDTIARNIRFSRDDITEEDIISAAKQADIHGFIQNLPDGLNTIVGERGVFLSGGERQRIILARALAGKPKILILDEATSALDHKTESSIKKTIGQLKGKMTIIIIAHRLSSIENTDRVAVLDRGRIIEQGAPGELLAKPDSYFNKMRL